MEKYGYMYDKLAKDMEQFVSKPSLKTEESPYLMTGMGVVALMILIWIIVKT